MPHSNLRKRLSDTRLINLFGLLKGRRRPSLPVIILTGGFAVAIAVANLHPKPQPKAAKPTPTPLVDVVIAKPQTLALPVWSQGTVAPRREIDLVAQVAGRIELVQHKFVDGGFFASGETLIQIEDRDYRFALVTAEASLTEAKQALATERGRVRQASREWRELGNSEANELFLRKPQLAAAEAGVASASAARDKARLDLERTRIKVPFSGRIRQTYVDLGQYVAPGTPIAKVYDTEVAEIRLPLTDRQSALVDLPFGFRGDAQQPGPAVTIFATIGGQRHQWSGRITRTDASVDVRSRMYYAVAEIEQPFVSHADADRPPLVVGLFVEAQIEGKLLQNIISLPKQALFKRNQLYLLNEQQQLVHKTVSLLHSDRKQAWVRGDIAPGSAIVSGRQQYLVAGLSVEPRVGDESQLAETQLIASQDSPQPAADTQSQPSDSEASTTKTEQATTADSQPSKEPTDTGSPEASLSSEQRDSNTTDETAPAAEPQATAALTPASKDHSEG